MGGTRGKRGESSARYIQNGNKNEVKEREKFLAGHSFSADNAAK